MASPYCAAELESRAKHGAEQRRPWTQGLCSAAALLSLSALHDDFAEPKTPDGAMRPATGVFQFIASLVELVVGPFPFARDQSRAAP